MGLAVLPNEDAAQRPEACKKRSAHGHSGRRRKHRKISRKPREELSPALNDVPTHVPPRAIIPPPASGRQNRKQKAHTAAQMAQNAMKPKGPADAWALYVQFLDKNFFTSAEAKMKVNERVRKGLKAYEGLRIDHNNSFDMRRMYELRWEPRTSMGQSLGTYGKFRGAVGQLARFCVSFKLTELETLYRKGELFHLLCHMKGVKAFIKYFQIRGAVATVMAKAMHLVRLGEFAECHFAQARDETRRAQVLTTCDYLRAVAASQKMEARREARQRKGSDARVETGMFLQAEDFEAHTRVACDSLRNVMSTVKTEMKQAREQSDSFELNEYLSENHALVRKWNINFMSALVLTGGGQRPQVYTQLQLPSGPQMGALRELVRTKL